jgi:hypothetical protein
MYAFTSAAYCVTMDPIFMSLGVCHKDSFMEVILQCIWWVTSTYLQSVGLTTYNTYSGHGLMNIWLAYLGKHSRTIP